MNQIIKTSFILATLLSSLACAQELDQDAVKKIYYDSTNDIELNRKNKSEDSTSQKKVEDDYRDAVVYEYVKAYGQAGAVSVTQATSKEDIVFNRVAYQKTLDTKRKEELATLNVKAEEAKYHHLKGYCSFRNPVEISMIKSYAVIYCEFKDSAIPRAKMTVSLNPLPDYKSLVARSIDIDPGRGDMSYDVVKGIVMTADQSSINIANFYNDVAAERILATSAIGGSDIIIKESLAYLEDQKQSRTDSQVTYVSGGVGGTTTPVVTTNSTSPQASDYIISGALQLASTLVKVIGQSFLDDTHYIFKIYEGNQVYVDVVVKEHIEGGMMTNKEGALYADEQYRDVRKAPNVIPVQTTRGMSSVPTVTKSQTDEDQSTQFNR